MAVTSDLPNQLMELKHIRIACETEYSKIIQVKLRYGQSNEFRRCTVIKVGD